MAKLASFSNLDVSVESASLREDLPAVRTNDSVDAVNLPDVGVEVGQSFLVAAERTTLGWWDRVEETSGLNFTFLSSILFKAQLLKVSDLWSVGPRGKGGCGFDSS